MISEIWVNGWGIERKLSISELAVMLLFEIIRINDDNDPLLTWPSASMMPLIKYVLQEK